MKKIVVFLFFAFAMSSTVKAESTVYFIWDHVMGWDELPFYVNGEYAFSIVPDLKSSSPIPLYTKAIRKVVFKKTGRYVVSFEREWFQKPYHAETILNLEDGETYFVVMDAKINGLSFGEVSQKQGDKFLKKAGKKYVLNDDFFYDK